MTEPTPADGVTPDAPPPADTRAPDEPKPVTAEDLARVTAALDKERDARKKAEKDARDALQQARAGMAEDDRKLLEAEERGRAAVRSEYGQRLAESEFRAAAAARNPGFDIAKALRYVNLAGFVGEDGEPDPKAITAAVTDLVPEAAPGTPPPPTFDGGARTTTPNNSTASQFANALGSLLP